MEQLRKRAKTPVNIACDAKETATLSGCHCQLPPDEYSAKGLVMGHLPVPRDRDGLGITGSTR
jgi:hypothetical protein